MEQKISDSEIPEEQSVNQEKIPNQEVSEPGNTVILCDSIMDISGVEELFHQLEKALDVGQDIEIHAQEVERMDTAMAQLLVVFVKEAEHMKLEVIWQGVSEGMLSTFRNIGVLDYLKMPESAYL